MARHPLDPRNTRAWQKLATQVVLEEPVCWLQLPGCTIRSTTADHIIPPLQASHLAMVRSNLRGACKHCNSSRQDTPIDQLDGIRNRPAALTFFD